MSQGGFTTSILANRPLLARTRHFSTDVDSEFRGPTTLSRSCPQATHPASQSQFGGPPHDALPRQQMGKRDATKVATEDERLTMLAKGNQGIHGCHRHSATAVQKPMCNDKGGRLSSNEKTPTAPEQVGRHNARGCNSPLARLPNGPAHPSHMNHMTHTHTTTKADKAVHAFLQYVIYSIHVDDIQICN